MHLGKPMGCGHGDIQILAWEKSQWMPLGFGHGDIQILAWKKIGGCRWVVGTATFRFWHGKKSVDAVGLWARRHSDSGMGKNRWMPLGCGHGDIQILAWEKIGGCRAPTLLQHTND